MTDWFFANNLPYITGRVFNVWLKDGSVRNVYRSIASPYIVNCESGAHPASNMFCSNEDIVAWRMTDYLFEDKYQRYVDAYNKAVGFNFLGLAGYSFDIKVI